MVTLLADARADPCWKELPRQFHAFRGKEAVYAMGMLIDGARFTEQEAEVAIAVLAMKGWLFKSRR